MKKKHFIIYLFLFLGMCQQIMAQTLYVDGSFTGTSDGSAAAPYTNIGDALAARELAGVSNMTSDEEIIVKGGTYTPTTTTESGFITATSGGFGSYWLTIRPETGETVIIDGANLFDDKFAALITVTSGATNVRIQGFKLQNQKNNPALTTVDNGVTILDVKFGIQLGNYVTNVEILDNEIYDFSWTAAADPMKTRTTFTAAEITAIKTATGSDNCGPISVVGTDITPITGLVIKNNYIHNVIPGYTEGIQVNGNVDGFEISDNTITEVQNIGIVAAGHYDWVESIAGATVTSALNQARNGVIKGNNVSSCRSPIAAAAGIYCDGSQNIIVENNISSDGQVGFSIGNENVATNSGGHTVRNNITYDNAWTGFIVGVPAAAVDSYIDNVSLTGNTSFRNGGVTDTYLGVMGQSELIINRNIQNLTVQNNIFYTTNHANLISVSAPFSTAYQGYFATFDIDYNTYYTNTTTGNTGIFDYSQSGVVGYYGTFAFYQSQNPNGYGYDQNSQFVNPQFVDTASAILDLNLLASSPAIDAGNPAFTGTGETDYLGNARVFNSIVDAGAYESTATSVPNLTSLTVTDDATNLTITVLGNVIEPTYDTFIDIDNDPATGYSGGSILGADFYISGGIIYSYSGTAPAWGWTATTGVTVTDTTGSREFVIDKTTLGLLTSGQTINVLYQNTVNFVATDVLPTTGMLAYTTTTDYSVPNLTSLTVTDDATNLTVTVLGNVIEPTYDAFIDIDNDPATGYSGGSILGADFYISGGIIYSYSGTAPAWGWTATTGVTVTDTTGSREFVIDRTTLGLTNSGTTINVLYQNTINFVATDVLPETGMLAYTTTTGTAAPNLTSLTVTDDTTNLTVTVLGTVIEPTYDAFIDVDNNAATGYSGGSILGADFYISGGIIYSYSGTAPAWGWTATTGVTVTDTTGSREFVIDRTTLGLTNSGTTINVLYQNTVNFVATDVIPATGMLAYTTTTAVGTPCTASVVTPYINHVTPVNMWFQKSDVTLVETHANVWFKVESVDAGTVTWTGPTGSNFTVNNGILYINTVATIDAGNYTATFTNDCGEETTQVFTLNVNALCTASVITPYVNLVTPIDFWSQTNIVNTAEGYPNIWLKVESTDSGTVTWTGPANSGFSLSNEVLLLNSLAIEDAGVYTATFTNACGTQTTQTFTVNVAQNCSLSELETYWGGDNANNAGLLATGNEGEYLYLSPETDITTGTWSWTGPNGAISNNGDKNLEFIPLSASDSGDYTVTYVIGSCTHTATYTLSVTAAAFPDPNKTYYIDAAHGTTSTSRLASTGQSEDAYATAIGTTGDDVEWKFVDKGNGYWHIQRAAGGSKPRLRTDNSINADMQPTSSSGGYTYYDFTNSSSASGAYHLTLPNGPTNYKRLQITPSGVVRFTKDSFTGTWVSFYISETGNSAKASESKTSILETLKLYPNPASSIINVSGLQEGEKMRVFDLIGNLIIETTNAEINVSNLKSGIYVLKSDLHNSVRFIKK